MAKCIDCLECVKEIGEKETVFFCFEDENISDEKFEKEHNCKSYNPDVVFQVGKVVPSYWLHGKLDEDDFVKYANGTIIETQAEANRLSAKYE